MDNLLKKLEIDPLGMVSQVDINHSLQVGGVC